MVYGVGVNDMPKGWTVENEYNYRVYQLWKDMIKRCYSNKFHEKFPTYVGCTVCVRWLTLSNFVEDVVKIDNYEYWRDNPNQGISLDKDIKSNNQNKCYCLKNCMFVSNAENTRQANRARTGEKNPHALLVDRFDLKGNYIDTGCQCEYVQKMGFHSGHISSCCQWYACGEDLEKWRKTHNYKPVKSVKGFIFKYHDE